MGLTYAGLMVHCDRDELQLEQISGKQEAESTTDTVNGSISHVRSPVWLRVEVNEGPKCIFSYSFDGKNFSPLGKPFEATPGRWIGAKVGLVCLGKDSYVDVNWFRVDSN
jgi:beta-xylosidase